LSFIPFIYPGNGAKVRNFSATNTSVSLPSAGEWSGIAYNGSVWAAVMSGSTAAATSTDAITWTARTTSGSSNWNGLDYRAGVFCTVGSGSTAAQTSTDGITWNSRTLPVSDSWYITNSDGSFNKPGFMAISTNGSYTAYSTNGITWTQGTFPVSSQYWNAAYNGTVWLSMSENFANWFTTSTNGTTWSAKQTTFAHPIPNLLDKMGFYKIGPYVLGTTFYVAIDYNQRTWIKSTNGTNWTINLPNKAGQPSRDMQYARHASDGTTIIMAHAYGGYSENGMGCSMSSDCTTWRYTNMLGHRGSGFALSSKISTGGGLVVLLGGNNGGSKVKRGALTNALSRP
jgi:hypothetical protein